METATSTNLFQLAEALFDNESEWPDELELKKGEILRVIDTKPSTGSTVQGWWICVNCKGVCGIAPANRLKIIEKAEPEKTNISLLGDFRFNSDDPMSNFNDSFHMSPSRRLLDFPDHDQLLSEFKNFRLLHGVDRPYKIDKLYDMDDFGSMNNNGLYSTLKKNGTIRNVPINIEHSRPVTPSTSGAFTPTPASPQRQYLSPRSRQKSPPAPPSRRQVTYNFDGLGKTVSAFDGQSVSSDNMSNFNGTKFDTYDSLPKRASPSTIYRPTKPSANQQQHRVRFAADFNSDSIPISGNFDRQISSSETSSDDRSVGLTSSSANSIPDASTVLSTSDRPKNESCYDIPRHFNNLLNGVDNARLEQIVDNSTQNFLNNNAMTASIYDAPQSIGYSPMASNHCKSTYDDYDFVDGKSSSNLANGDDKQTAESDYYRERLQILSFYVPQVDSQMDSLNRAIDEFLSCVEANAPPREFVAKGRFVVLSAHKLVYLGDSLSHCLKSVRAPRNLTERIMGTCDRLCNTLKSCVSATKRACESFPCVEYVQAMVDCMVGISNDAQEFKLLVAQAQRA